MPLNLELEVEVVVVEDEKLAREALARLLKTRGYDVTEAASGSEAIVVARKESVSVVLMDLDLGEDRDGLEIAEEMQAVHALSSVIFVSGKISDEYRERASRYRIRVGGWVEKPIDGERLKALVQLIEEEMGRLAMLVSLETVRAEGADPYEFLRQFGRDLPERVVEALEEELDAGEDLLPLQSGEDLPEVDMRAISREIDVLYDQIRDLIAERAGDPELKVALEPLRRRLCELQEQEAEAMELHFRAQIVFDPREGRELMKEMERKLGKR